MNHKEAVSAVLQKKKKKRKKENKNEKVKILQRKCLSCILHRVIIVDIFLRAHCTCMRALVPGTTVRVHGRRGHSLSNCSLNVSAASLDFLQTGPETFWLLVFARPVSLSCCEPAVSILNDHLLALASESPLLFARRRALCSCMLYLSIQRLSPIYII